MYGSESEPSISILASMFMNVNVNNGVFCWSTYFHPVFGNNSFCSRVDYAHFAVVIKNDVHAISKLHYFTFLIQNWEWHHHSKNHKTSSVVKNHPLINYSTNFTNKHHRWSKDHPRNEIMLANLPTSVRNSSKKELPSVLIIFTIIINHLSSSQ